MKGSLIPSGGIGLAFLVGQRFFKKEVIDNGAAEAFIEAVAMAVFDVHGVEIEEAEVAFVFHVEGALVCLRVVFFEECLNSVLGDGRVVLDTKFLHYTNA